MTNIKFGDDISYIWLHCHTPHWTPLTVPQSLWLTLRSAELQESWGHSWPSWPSCPLLASRTCEHSDCVSSGPADCSPCSHSQGKIFPLKSTNIKHHADIATPHHHRLNSWRFLKYFPWSRGRLDCAGRGDHRCVMCRITLWLICFLLASAGSAGSNQSIQHSLFNSLNNAAGKKYFGKIYLENSG